MEARELPKPPPEAFDLMLRIRHPSLDPEEISRVLCVEPEHCFKAGEPRTSPRSASSSSVHAETYWLARLNSSSWTSDPQLIESPELTGEIDPRMNVMYAMPLLGRALLVSGVRYLRPHAEFLTRIQAEGGEVRVLVELNPAVVDGFTLTPDLARVLSSFNIPIDFAFSAD